MKGERGRTTDESLFPPRPPSPSFRAQALGKGQGGGKPLRVPLLQYIGEAMCASNPQNQAATVGGSPLPAIVAEGFGSRLLRSDDMPLVTPSAQNHPTAGG